MPGYIAVAGGVILIAFFVLYHFRSRKLPPKAQFICDVWKKVESANNSG